MKVVDGLKTTIEYFRNEIEKIKNESALDYGYDTDDKIYIKTEL